MPTTANDRIAAVGRSVAELWAEAEDLNNRLLAETAARTDAEVAARTNEDDDADYNRLFALENAVLSGPICTKADAIAKLRAAAVWFERGEKADGGDYRAFAQAVSWLEAA